MSQKEDLYQLFSIICGIKMNKTSMGRQTLVSILQKREYWVTGEGSKEKLGGSNGSGTKGLTEVDRERYNYCAYHK